MASIHSDEIPLLFCWTKMGAEAGQPLQAIIARKEAERQLGKGVFFWGIGTALGNKVWNFVRAVQTPRVLFSPMRSRPKQMDVLPEKIVIWTAYYDKSGAKHPMPKHVFITSRASDDLRRKQHYALVCRKSTSLQRELWPTLTHDHMRNFEGSQLGFSQVTAIVEFQKREPSERGAYEIAFGAELVAPYYVSLADPVPLSKKMLKTINTFWNACDGTSDKWAEWIKETKACCLPPVRSEV